MVRGRGAHGAASAALPHLTARGTAPKRPYQPLYEYCWLYSAVEPKSGETFYLEMPSLDPDCFTVFLSEFARCYAESLNVVVLEAERLLTSRAP